MGAVPAELLSPLALGLLGLCIGSFLNVVIHRLPLMLERQWWAEVAQHLADEAVMAGARSGRRPTPHGPSRPPITPSLSRPSKRCRT
jgi:leader peptidase (prepilin peptidase)/N-methyltransferase